MPASADGSARQIVPRIALFVEAVPEARVQHGGGDWHARRLTHAMEARGATVVTTSLNKCAFDTRLPSGLDIPGFAGALPNGAFVRSVSAGSLEQITMRLGILHALDAAGVLVWNNPRAIERCVDKSTATWRFQRAGLPTPATRTAEGREDAQIYRKGRGTLVLKPLFGSQGNGVRRLHESDDLPPPEAVGDVFYLQEYLRGPDAASFEDWRVLVSRGRVLAAMIRRGKSWITNVHQGAVPVSHDPDAEMRDYALRAAEAVGADYAGVDLIRAKDGRLLVLEINSNPAWKGLQSVSGLDIADALAADFLGHVASRVPK